MAKYEKDNSEDEVEDIYDEETMEKAVEDDEISSEEQGFLHGYQESIKKKRKTNEVTNMKKLIYLYLFILILLTGCSNNSPQQVIENNLTNDTIIQNSIIQENTTILENKTEVIENITNQTISNETELPENTYKMYVNDKIIYNYKIIILQQVTQDGQVTISVDNMIWTIYQTKDPDIVNGLEIQTLETNLKENYALLEIKPFVLKKDRYLFYKGQTLVMDNITNITLMDINNDNSIFLQILNGMNLVGKYDVLEGDSITANNLTITNIKSYKRELGYENHAILRIVKNN